MPYQMKDGRWRAEKMISGRRKTKTCITKAEAKKWEAEQNETEWNTKETTPTASLHDIATLYLADCEPRHHKKTFDAKKLSLKRLFLTVPPGTLPEEFTALQALNVLTSTARAVSNAAANKVRKHLSAFWAFGKKYHGFPVINPFQEVERLPENPDCHYVPPEDDFWKVYKCADNADKVMLLTLLYTAGRRSEVLRLTWADVNLGARKIRLTTFKTKSGSAKKVWLGMTDELFEALKGHAIESGMRSEYVFTSKRTGEPYADRKHFITRLCERAKVEPKFNYHGIRGLAATILATKLSISEVRDILRHAQVSTTDRYIRSLGVTKDRLNEAFSIKKATPEEGASKVA